MLKIIKKNSPNHFNGRCGLKADMIAFHQTGNNSAAKSISYYMNKDAKCSPHFVINVNGDIYQLVELTNGAWANGTSDDPSDNKYYGYSLSEIVRKRKTNANYYTYSIEFVHCQWGNISEEQKTAVVQLIGEVIIPDMLSHGVKPIIDRAHLVGHSDITPKTRDPEKFNCPGKKFPYDEIISRVNGGKPVTKPTTVTPAKTVDEIAREVIFGKWSAGEERKKRLTDAGYDYYEVQARVNEILRG